jgi:hypothetical protein
MRLLAIIAEQVQRERTERSDDGRWFQIQTLTDRSGVRAMCPAASIKCWRGTFASRTTARPRSNRPGPPRHIAPVVRYADDGPSR